MHRFLEWKGEKYCQSQRNFMSNQKHIRSNKKHNQIIREKNFFQILFTFD